jgi:hypothetical protein
MLINYVKHPMILEHIDHIYAVAPIRYLVIVRDACGAIALAQLLQAISDIINSKTLCDYLQMSQMIFLYFCRQQKFFLSYSFNKFVGVAIAENTITHNNQDSA